MKISRSNALRGLTAIGCALGLATAARAELLIALRADNTLVAFDSATPSTISVIGAVTGLAAGDTLVGIDRRPQVGPNNGKLYGVGVNLGTGSARIYTLNETNAAATLVSTLTADPTDATPPTPFTTVAGTSFGVDFNPTADRLRLVSNSAQNLRINVDNGFTQLDVSLAYQAGDPNFGDAPVNDAIAYSNNFGGAPTTTLRGVDIGQSPDLLVVHSDPNAGLLQTSLNLPFDSTVTAYDISGLSGTQYFLAITGTASSLYASGPGGVTLIGTIGGPPGAVYRGLAAPVGVPAGTISGIAFDDLDGDGVRDPGEPGLAGITITRDSPPDGVPDGSTVTAADGSYSFNSLPPATYRIRQVTPAGRVQTSADPADIVLAGGASQAGVDFGSFGLITISGRAFDDLNDNGVFDFGEPGLAGFTITLDSPPDNVADSTTITAIDGSYSFVGLGPGTYRIRQITPAGRVQTSANPADIVAVSGVDAAGVDFGSRLAPGIAEIPTLGAWMLAALAAALGLAAVWRLRVLGMPGSPGPRL